MEVILLSTYTRNASKLLGTSDCELMESEIAADPTAYPVIPRTGGFRKAR